MKYYITKDNDNGISETIAVINGSVEDAKKAFSEAIEAQVEKYRISKTIDHWHVLKMFDDNGNQIAQES